jgi:hypothetical protein
MLGFRQYLWLIINGCGSRNKYINVILRFTPCLSIGRFRKEEIYSDTPNNENIHLTTVTGSVPSGGSSQSGSRCIQR